MPIRVVTGPPFGGKSQAVEAARRPGDVLLDTTAMWRALYSPEPGAVRTMDEARVAQQAKRAALDRAVDLDADGWLTVAERDPIKLKRWLDAAGASKAWLVTAPMATLRSRARRRGPSCEALVDKWDDDYENDSAFTELTEQWSDDDMRTNIDAETSYRAAVEALTVREDGGDVQHRCLTDNAELRAADGDSRAVSGIAVRYGDEARLPGFRERIAKGALTLPAKASNLTLQHERAMPVGLLEWQDDDDAMRFRAEIAAGPRGDQALQDVRSGLLRGASLEFRPSKERLLEKDEGKGPLFEIMEAQVIRLSLVDDGAYPQSAIRLRVDPMEPAPRQAAPVHRPRRLMVV